MNKNLIIIGSGVAAYTTAIYAADNNLNPFIIAGGFEWTGGQLITTLDVQNYPGFPEGINGFDLMDKFKTQAVNHCLDALSEDAINKTTESDHIVYNNVIDVYPNIDDKFPYKFVVKTDSLLDSSDTTITDTYYTNCIVVATGATANKLTVPGATTLWNKGISSCATCHGSNPRYRNKHIVVLGGGNVAFEDALYLSKYGSNITIIYRKDMQNVKANKVNQKKVFMNSKISLVWNSNVISMNGNDEIESVTIKNHITNEITTIECGGLFYGIGHSPSSSFLKNSGVELDSEGYIVQDKNVRTKTNVDGIFSAGDVSDKRYRQATVASAMGTEAAIEAGEYLANLNVVTE